MKTCRNPHCRTRLAAHVNSRNKAFCTPGCHASFYLKRCLVCEGYRAARSRKTCSKPHCKNEYRRKRADFDYKVQTSMGGSGFVNTTKEVPIPWASFRLVSGPKYNKTAFYCAAIPDGSDNGWNGGEYERLEARNRAALLAATAKDCFTEPDWREVISPDGVRCWVTRPRPKSDNAPSDWKPCNPRQPIADDLTIPEFLRRSP